MRYSIWNYRARAYDYYDAPDVGEGTHVAAPPTPLVRPKLGATPDQAAWRLPAGAKKVGSGGAAQGKIASLGDSSSLSLTSVPVLAGLGALAYIIWKKR